MIWKKEIKTGLKVTFVLLQIAIIIAGLGTAVALLPLYFRIKSFTGLTIKSIYPALLACILSVTTGFLGYASLAQKKKMYFFLFVLSLASLMNLEMIMAFQSNKLVKDNTRWINSSWADLSDIQKDYVQEHMKCCGEGEDTCKYEGKCLDKFKGTIMVMRSVLEKFLVCMFFIETLSLSVLSFLKFGK